MEYKDFKLLCNIINTLTNIEGLYIVFFLNLPFGLKMAVLITTVSSMLMHISETKHHLPGISPFNEYSNHFLDLDRITSKLALLYGLYLCYYNSHKINIIWIIIMLFGCICLFLSEQIYNLDTWDHTFKFIVLHSIWHIIAFKIMSVVLSSIYL
jgi:hypothetical protein